MNSFQLHSEQYNNVFDVEIKQMFDETCLQFAYRRML